MNKQKKIFCIKASTVDFITIFKMKIYMLFNRNCKIAFDMKFVKNIKENFLSFIKKNSEDNRIGLFNLNSEIMALMNIMNYDKYVCIYTNENDFVQNTRTIVNRNFKVY